MAAPYTGAFSFAVAGFRQSATDAAQKAHTLRTQLRTQEVYATTNPLATDCDKRKASTLRLELAAALLELHSFNALVERCQELLEAPTVSLTAARADFTDPSIAALGDAMLNDSVETARVIRTHLFHANDRRFVEVDTTLVHHASV